MMKNILSKGACVSWLLLGFCSLGFSISGFSQSSNNQEGENSVRVSTINEPTVTDSTRSDINTVRKGRQIYSNSLAGSDELAEWVMEGPGIVEFEDGWMSMYSPDEQGHHVFWCPKELPNSFVAEWEVQNMHPESGLCIVFFAAKGRKGEDVFDASLKERDGNFKQYTKGDINNYHISYYANTPLQKDRDFSHLRKNKGFNKVHVGKAGIPAGSRDIHKIRLVKLENNILMFLDGEKIIDWTDNGVEYGPVLEAGKFAFRQMKWTNFRYRDLNFWELEK